MHLNILRLISTSVHSDWLMHLSRIFSHFANFSRSMLYTTLSSSHEIPIWQIQELF